MSTAAVRARARDITRTVVRFPFVAAIRAYQLVISPWTMSSCRFYPSCSQYALEAVQSHGVVRGGWLAVRRLGRCHPWTAGGVDHVPPAKTPVPRETRARSLT